MNRDWANIRKDFPILNDTSHVYLDSAATSQKPQSVINAITKYYTNQNANIHRGIYSLSEEATMLYIASKEATASFINASSYRSIIYTRNATEGLNMSALLLENELEEGDEIVTTVMEHHSNLIPWMKLAQRKKCKITYVKVNEIGEIDMEEFKNSLNSKTKIVAFSHISNVLGTINPIDDICQIAKRNGAYIVIDGAQAVGHIPVDVGKYDCDFYAFSSHKMFGPTGLGVLYIKEELLDRFDPIFYGGEMVSHVALDEFKYNELPWKFEAGTPHIAGGIALHAAIIYLQEIGIENIEKRNLQLLQILQTQLQDLPYIKMYGTSPQKSSVVSFTMDGVHSHDIASLLDRDHICIRAGNHCAEPLVHSLSCNSLARVSLHIYNNEEDIQKLLISLKNIYHKLKNG